MLEGTDTRSRVEVYSGSSHSQTTYANGTKSFNASGDQELTILLGSSGRASQPLPLLGLSSPSHHSRVSISRRR